MWTGLLVAMVLAQGPQCLEGLAGDGARGRRVVVEVVPPAAAVVHLYGRPVRRSPLLRANGSDGTFASDDASVRLVLRGDSAELELTVAGTPARVSLRGAAAMQHSLGKDEWHARIGPGGVIRMGVRVERGPCGLVEGVLDSPDQGQLGLPLTHVTVAHDTLHVGASYMDLRLAIPLHDAAEVTGSMTQQGATTPVTLRRGREVLHRPQEPQGTLPYDARAVSFPSREGFLLHGTLTVPRGGGVHPAVVLIGGSGAQDRDEQIAGHRPFLVLSDHLTRRGYAVLRTDDRGVGGTAGSVIDSDLHAIAEDVRGALDFLAAHAEIDAGRIGLLGHSEGGYVAPIVAADDARVGFMILLGASAHRGRDMLLLQRAAMNRGEGTPEHEVRVDSAMLAVFFEVFDTRLEDAALPVAVDSALAAWLRSLEGAERGVAMGRLAERTAAADSQSLALWRSPWFRGLYRHDPETFLRRTDVPVLAVVGALDLQVPAHASAQRFRALYDGARANLLTLHTPAGVNHMLQPARTGRMEEYAQTEITIADSVLQLLDTWLAATVPVSSTASEVR